MPLTRDGAARARAAPRAGGSLGYPLGAQPRPIDVPPPPRGGAPPTAARLGLALAYWLRWNLAIAPHAVARFRVEDLTFDALVARWCALCDDGRCRCERPKEEEVLSAGDDAAHARKPAPKPGYRNGSSSSVTWPHLWEGDAHLASAAFALAQEYGYYPGMLPPE